MAFSVAAVEATGATRVFIGADPWLFNQHVGSKARWTSVEKQYRYWKDVVEGEAVENAPPLPENSGVTGWSMRLLYGLYNAVNQSELATDNGAVGSQAKRARDGELIYAADYAMMSDERRNSTLPRFAKYKMQNYAHSHDRQQLFEQLLAHLTMRGVEVTLLLSPYHPGSYEIIVENDLEHLNAEARFRDLAERMGITVLGGYDSRVVGCATSEFYDGIHPRPSCMAKVLEATSRR